ncbi:hypothetical protein ABZT47_28945 [Sphaerisporangium sp. NPDC005289]|uniref:hypothetical protein n=1 Tax=Sphaerisporangium sp. NPDC005289 TaxID=3155247 RepID=UPI0033AB3846
MAVNNSVDPATWLAEQIETGDPDLVRSPKRLLSGRHIKMAGSPDWVPVVSCDDLFSLTFSDNS